jgi:hypothetical protein
VLVVRKEVGVSENQVYVCLLSRMDSLTALKIGDKYLENVENFKRLGRTRKQNCVYGE